MNKDTENAQPETGQTRTTGIARTFLRFPLALLSVIIGTTAAFQLTAKSTWENAGENFLLKLVFFSWLGLILFFVLQLFSERYQLNPNKKWLLQGTGAVLLIVVFLLLPDKLNESQFLRLFIIGLGLHLVSAYAPFFNSRVEHKFWQFNERIFIRILTAGLYTFVLFSGLSLAILAADQLFNLSINERLYLYLWIFLIGIFNTWFFLAGVPVNYEALESEKHYPKGLKVFNQYVLLPLVTLYLVILYLYMFKILLRWEWPLGWVSNLIIGFSVAGILSLLLVHPIRNQQGNTWVRSFTKWFYLAIIPLLILFSLAIWRRVSEYGITENRYFVLMLAFWLLLVTIYFLVSRQKNIKFIPVTLSALVFISAVGPLNAFAVSEFSQVNRLQNLLAKNGMLTDGKLKPAHASISNKDKMQILSIFDYLQQKRYLDNVIPWVPESLPLLTENATGEVVYNQDNLNVIYNYLGLNRPWEALEPVPETPADTTEMVVEEQQYFTYTLPGKGITRTTGYDYYTTTQFNSGFDNRKVYELDAIKLSIERETDNRNFVKNRLLLWLNNTDSVSVPTRPMVQRLLDEQITPTEADLSQVVTIKDIQIKLVFDRVSGSVTNGKAFPHEYNVSMFVRLPKK